MLLGSDASKASKNRYQKKLSAKLNKKRKKNLFVLILIQKLLDGKQSKKLLRHVKEQEKKINLKITSLLESLSVILMSLLMA